jgi:hypothetical protein
MYDGKIPHDQHGSPVPYVIGHIDKYVWKDNEEFLAALTFKRFARGRSAAHAVYAKDNDPTWEAVMFITDLTDVIERGLAPLHLCGRFVHVKRGQNYGIQLIGIVS